MLTIKHSDAQTFASLYKVCRQGLKDVYDILTELDLQKASKEEVVLTIEDAIDSIEQTKEMLEE